MLTQRGKRRGRTTRELDEVAEGVGGRGGTQQPRTTAITRPARPVLPRFSLKLLVISSLEAVNYFLNPSKTHPGIAQDPSAQCCAIGHTRTAVGAGAGVRTAFYTGMAII